MEHYFWSLRVPDCPCAYAIVVFIYFCTLRIYINIPKSIINFLFELNLSIICTCIGVSTLDVV